MNIIRNIFSFGKSENKRMWLTFTMFWFDLSLKVKFCDWTCFFVIEFCVFDDYLPTYFLPRNLYAF